MKRDEPTSEIEKSVVIEIEKDSLDEMIEAKGSGLKGKNLSDFIRMIQASIPQQSLSLINSDTTVEINQDRRINNLITKKYQFWLDLYQLNIKIVII